MPVAGPPLLEIDDLTVTIATPGGPLAAVSGISYAVHAGETFAIVGESGCGKSMSSLAVMGLAPPAATVSARACRFDGVDMLTQSRAQLSAIRGRTIAMIFQDPMMALNPVYTIGDQLAEVHRRHMGQARVAAGSPQGSRHAQARDRAIYLLERVGIRNAAARLGQYPHQLSGGLRQRVMIAMALMCEPKLIIADEPTTALDVTVQARILALLRDLKREMGMALVLITHDLGVVAGMADRIAVMYAGHIVETGTARQIFRAPGHPYTRGLIACLPGRTPPGGRLTTIPGMVPSLIGKAEGCLFRNRCGHARPACAEGDIALREAAPGHVYRCVLSTSEMAEAAP